ncbi:MAG: dephospho-CoA kinase [Bdellovibrionales bacterium]
MKWIAITGGIACGKSSVGDYLRSKSYVVINADEIVHSLFFSDKNLLLKVRERFGDSVFDEENLNREKLGDLVFSDPVAKKNLESIVHPLVLEKSEQLKQEAEEAGAEFAFYEIPLLFELGREAEFDSVICVSASLDTQITRLKKRNQLSTEQALARINSQMDMVKKIERSDFVIQNDFSNIEELHKEITKLLRENF